MSITDMFTEVLLDHYKHPRHYGVMENADVVHESANPLCGDELTLYAKFDGNTLSDVMFEAKACAICTASTSMFSEITKGKSFEEVDSIGDIVHSMFKGDELTSEQRHTIGDILALEGVQKLPVRIKCALLVWETWQVIKKDLDQQK
ncbi:Fe-S cluster assembly sulfur transfer protein SufU [Calditrichota bacterium]